MSPANSPADGPVRLPLAPGLDEARLRRATATLTWRLEACLHRQAVSVEHHWRLYPAALRPDCPGAARVQCRLRK